MATVTLNGTTNADALVSSSTTYATARSGNLLALIGAFEGRTGQRLNAGTYDLYETFIEFDSSGLLAAGDTITAAVLKLYLRFDDSTTDFLTEVYVRDYGAAVDTADWVPGGSFGGLTKVAQIDSSTVTASAYNSFADVNLPANIVKNGITRLVLVSARVIASTVPAGDEYLTWYATDATNFPKIDVTYTPAAAGGSYAGMLGLGMIG